MQDRHKLAVHNIHVSLEVQVATFTTTILCVLDEPALMQIFPASSVLSFHFCVAMSSSTEGGGRPGNGADVSESHFCLLHTHTCILT